MDTWRKMFQREGTKISKAQDRGVIGLFMQCQGALAAGKHCLNRKVLVNNICGTTRKQVLETFVKYGKTMKFYSK